MTGVAAPAEVARSSRVLLLPSHRYAEWDEFVRRSPHGSIFHTSWWLQAVGWPLQIMVAEDASGRLLAGMPLPQAKFAGLRMFYTPPLTPYVGPIFDLSISPSPRVQLEMMRTLGEQLAGALPEYDGLSYWVAPPGPDLQGFLWAGFRVELGYTFKFPSHTPAQSVVMGAAPAHSAKVRRAERAGLRVELSDDVERCLRLSRMTFQRNEIEYPWDGGLVRRLWQAARERNAARLYVGVTADGKDAAASLIVDDGTTGYHLLAGNDPELRAVGAGNLVLLRAIVDTLESGRAFDFEGSELRGVEWHYRRWGAAPEPVYLLERAGSFAGAVARLWSRRKRYRQIL